MLKKNLYRSRLNFSMSVILVKERIQLFNRKISNLIGILPIKFFFLFFLALDLPACFFNPVGLSTAFNLRSIGAEFNIADSEYFYVDLDVDSYESGDGLVPLYEISTTEDYGDSVTRASPSNCEIEHIPFEEGEERESSETIICILDVLEFDFMVKDLNIIYNFPEEMCDYMTVSLPWHFNYPIYDGPISIECPVSVGEGEDATEESLFCNADYQDNLKSCPAGASETSCYKEEEDLCPSFPGGPKCCNGGETSEGESWKLDRKCFGGPGLVAPGYEDFIKEYVHEVTEGGLRGRISLTNVVESAGGVGFSVPFANYIEELDVRPRELDTLNRDGMPPFLQSSDYYRYPPRLFFEFKCHDSAKESPHEILLLIREWNTFEEFWDFYEEGGKDGPDPDVEGYEGTDCAYEKRVRGGVGSEQALCNDMLDLDDLRTCDSDLYAECVEITERVEIYPGIPYGSEETFESPQ